MTRDTCHAPRDVLPDEMSHGGEREVRRAHGGARQQLRRPQQRKISGAGPQVQVQVGAGTWHVAPDTTCNYRIKAAQKHELYEASQGVSALSRVTVRDIL